MSARSNSSKKGSGKVLQSLIFIFFLLLILGFFIANVLNEQIRNERILLEQLEVTKVKNVHALLRDSLNMTWHISAIQSIFHTGDESIGCGFDDDPAVTGRSVPELADGYWYQYKPSEPKGDERVISLIIGKYSNDGVQPAVCMPRDEHAVDYLKDKFEPLKQIKNSFTVESVAVDITDISNRFSLQADRVLSTTAERLRVAFGDTEINRREAHENVVGTKFQGMVAAGRLVVRHLLLLSDTSRRFDNTDLLYDYAFRYQDDRASTIGLTTDANHVAYIDRVARGVEFPIVAAAQTAGLGVRINNNYELLPIDDTMQGLKSTPITDGLAFHYDVAVTLIDGTAASSPVAAFAWPTDSRRITSCFGEIRGGERHGGLDIGALQPGVEGDPVYAAEAGRVIEIHQGCRAGDTQPHVCTLNGNFVKVQHSNGLVTTYIHMASVTVGAGDTVSRGQQIGTMGNTGASTATHLDFRVKGSSQELNPCDFISCQDSTLRRCSSSGMGAGMSFAGDYRYYDEDANEFTKRPFSLTLNAEDYLVAIDCNERPYPDADPLTEARKNAVRFFAWNRIGDMACCGGKLWTCGLNDVPSGSWTRQNGEEINDNGCTAALQVLGVRDLVCTGGTFDVVP